MSSSCLGLKQPQDIIKTVTSQFLTMVFEYITLMIINSRQWLKIHRTYDEFLNNVLIKGFTFLLKILINLSYAWWPFFITLKMVLHLPLFGHSTDCIRTRWWYYSFICLILSCMIVNKVSRKIVPLLLVLLLSKHNKEILFFEPMWF